MEANILTHKPATMSKQHRKSPNVMPLREAPQRPLQTEKAGLIVHETGFARCVFSGPNG